MKASAIASYLDRPLIGRDVDITRIADILSPVPGALMYAQQEVPRDAAQQLSDMLALVLVTPELEGLVPSSSRISVDAPRLAFARVATEFIVPPASYGIASTAVISSDADLGSGVSIGEFTVVGPRCRIGDRSRIGHHVVLNEAVVVGRDTTIKSHAVIGEDGFGFERDGTRIIRVPHVGGVAIGDRVEVGASTVIARGTFGETTIGDDVKIDDHVFVAHNVKIGQGATVIAGAEISGSVRIGKGVWIGPQACIRDQIRVEPDATIGMGAVVTKGVAPRTTVAGNPARKLRHNKMG